MIIRYPSRSVVPIDPLAYSLGCASAASVMPGNHPLGFMLAAARSWLDIPRNWNR